MSTVIQDFLISIGFTGDDRGAKKIIDTSKRVEKEIKESDKRITESQEKHAARRTEAAKATSAGFEAIGKTVVAFAASATAGIYAMERMAAGLERLHYASSRTKSSAASLQAFSYAAGQLGSSAEEAMNSVEGIAEKMRRSPGFEAMFKSLGADTRKANGELRQSTDILLDLGDAFKKMPMFQQKAYADALGIPEQLLMSLTSGSFRKNIEKYEKMLGLAGLKPDEAAQKSKAFMDIWRDMGSAFSIISTKIQSALIDKFGGALEKFTDWLLANSGRISDAVISIGENIGKWALRAADLFKAFQDLNPKTQDLLIKIGALALALIAFSSGPIGALIALTAAIVAFVDDETLRKLQSMWEKFDALAQRLTGQDGLTVAMIALGGALALKVLAPLLRIVPLLSSLAGLSLPPWLLGLLGVGAAAAYANSQGVLAGPGDSRSTGESILRTLDPGIADRVYGQTAGGKAADQKDSRNLWQRMMPKALGGKDAPDSGGEKSGGSRSWRNNNPGNLKYGPFAQAQGATGQDDKGFAKFPSYDAGRKAQENLLFEDPRYKGKTLSEAMQQYAPSSENDTSGYIGVLAKAAGINANTKLDTLSPQQRTAMLDAMQKHEGWQAGSTSASAPSTSDAMAPAGTPKLRSGLATVKSSSGRSFQVAAEFAPNFQGFINDFEKAGGIVGPNSGGNNERMGNSSYHPLGRAIDVNQTGRDIRAGGRSLSDEAERAIARKWGLRSGADFRHPDGGHFEVNNAAHARAVIDAMRKGTETPAEPPLAEPKVPFGVNVDKLKAYREKFENGLNTIPKNNAWEANPFKSAPLGSWSNSSTSTTNNINVGPTTNNVSGAGDAKQTAEVIGDKMTRVHADLLRNMQGAVA